MNLFQKNKREKVILCIAYGNHSNRLFQNIHIEAFCIEHNIEYSNPTFHNIRKYYQEPCSTKNRLISFIIKLRPGRIIEKIKIIKKAYTIGELLNRLNILGFISAAEEGVSYDSILLSKFSAHKKIYVSGWHFRVPELSEKYKSLLIKKYTLKEDFYKDNYLYKQICEIKKTAIKIVGVHIRRGDYEFFNNGDYYFDDSVYSKYMFELKKELGDKCIFIIFSNENTMFRETETTYISRNKWYIDHHLMSLCDYLIGPPSTFTMWASYVSNAKYFHIKDTTGKIDLDSFEKY